MLAPLCVWRQPCRRARLRRVIYGLGVGAIVRMPAEPDWGLGQVQSIVGSRITVNFEHRGKVVLQGDHVSLELVAAESE